MHDLKQDSRQVRIAQNFQALGAALVLPQLKTLRTDLWAAQEATAIPSANAALGVLLERVWRDVHHKLKSLVLKMTYEKDLSKAEESLINQLRQEQPRTKKKLKY